MRKGFGKGENGIGDGELKGELANALLLRFSVSLRKVKQIGRAHV